MLEHSFNTRAPFFGTFTHILVSLILAISLSGCIAEDKPTSSQSSGNSNRSLDIASQHIDGVWRGKLNQKADIRILIYNGNVYALGKSEGFYGAAQLNTSNENAKFTLSSYQLSTNDSDDGQFVADGQREEYVFDGLRYTEKSEGDTIVGSYENDRGPGNFLFSLDKGWDSAAEIRDIKGKWASGKYELYVQPNSQGASFHGFSTEEGKGCSFKGQIRLLNEGKALFGVTLTKREHCEAFNEQDASGYAIISPKKALEFYIRKGSDLLFMNFDIVKATTGGDGSTDGGGTGGDGGSTGGTSGGTNGGGTTTGGTTGGTTTGTGGAGTTGTGTTGTGTGTTTGAGGTGSAAAGS